MKSALAVFAALMCCAMPATAAAAPDFDFFDIALCGKGLPFDSEASATALEDAFRKLERDKDQRYMRVYHLPSPISRDGYTTQSVGVDMGDNGAFMIGVLLDGKIAGELAKRYDLAPSSKNPKAYVRQIPWPQEIMGVRGVNTLLASDDAGFKAGQTFLGCMYGVDDFK